MNQMSPPDLVSESLADGVLTLTLGGGKAHPLSLGMIAALHRSIHRASEDTSVRVVVIHGPGSIFCAGHDLKEIARHREDGDKGRAYLEQLFNSCGAMMKAVTLCPKPTIAAVEGVATAGGLQLVAACDLAFASDASRYCLPGVNNGGFCTTPAVAVARVIGRKQVMEMALSGEMFDADWARGAGLINRSMPADELLPFVNDFAVRLATRHQPAIAAGKQTLYRQLEMPLELAYVHATSVMIDHFMDPERIEKEPKR
ncbi:enoyl-CoA hydratase [Sulfitobacter sp. BDSS02]|nr:enoyl-CoA hydratase [Sulfitobacter sp. BDSS02]MBR9850278.1 enoyl-CoA hydratase [Paracoccaceae bacterium]